MAGSQPLVLGSHGRRRCRSSTDEFGDPTKVKLAITVGGVPPASLDESMLGGGEVAGLLRFQNNDLVDAGNLLGRMALAIGTRDERAAGPGPGPQRQCRHGPVQARALPNGYPAATNTGGATLSMSVQANPSGTAPFVASDYEVTFTSGTAGTIVRLSDGESHGVRLRADQSGARSTASSIQQSATPATAGDRFLLKPFSTAAGSHCHCLFLAARAWPWPARSRPAPARPTPAP